MGYGADPLMVAPTLHLKGSARIKDALVFEGADLVAESGKWTCLLGSSGVGKSTVLRLFAGLDDEIDFQGEIGAHDGPLDGRIVLMAQQDMLLPWLTALDNVLLGGRLRGQAADRGRARDMLSRVGLVDLASRKPRELSGGQRQRVALARTVMENRPIVLLDEPFSALDARTRAQMQELTAELLVERTVLLVTHDPAEAARLGDKILIMTQSKISPHRVPSGQVPRPTGATEVLQAQADLLARLRVGEPA